MKVTRIQIKQFMGVEALDAQLPAAGAMVVGKNGGGKTTVLRAVRAALAARDIGPEAIRIGSDRAEILVDLDDVSVRWVITERGSTISVTKDGFRAPKPVAYLTELLGTSALDPVDLFLAKPSERRAKILAALPVEVTLAELRAWAQEIPDNFDPSGHGLDAVSRAHAIFYEKRKTANAAAKEAEGAAARAREAADALPLMPDALPVAVAEKTLAEARAEEAKLVAQGEAAKAAHAKSADVRARAAKLREEAKLADGMAFDSRVSPDALAVADGEIARHDDVIRNLERQLDDARRARESASLARTSILQRKAVSEKHETDAGNLRARADELEAAVAVAVDEPAAGDVVRAAERVRNAEAGLDAAKREQAREDARAKAKAAEEAAKFARGAADHLDEVVKRLANDAPAALLAKCGGVPGLSVLGDEVRLDGKSLDTLCGAEQMRFAVEIAKRMNAKTRILVCDRLESIDGDALQDFLRFATADGWQVICSRVERGEVRIEAIESVVDAEAAE